MADAKISALTELAEQPATNDYLPVVDTSATATKKITRENILGTSTRTRTINFIIDGGGSAITTGVKGDVVVDVACTIQSVTTLLDQSGSIVVDIWKDTYANFAPTDADTITASAPPTVTTATKAQDTTLTGWTTSIAAGDVLRFNVDSITTATRATVALKVLV